MEAMKYIAIKLSGMLRLISTTWVNKVGIQDMLVPHMSSILEKKVITTSLLLIYKLQLDFLLKCEQKILKDMDLISQITLLQVTAHFYTAKYRFLQQIIA